MEFHSLHLPDFWGSALVNGDYSGLTQQEESELNRFIEHWQDDLDFGCVRIKQSGGHAGHNGLRSISARLGGGDYPRVRVGIGRPAHGDNVTAHVLGAFNSVERANLDAVIERTCEAVETLLCEGVVAAMNSVNGQSPVC